MVRAFFVRVVAAFLGLGVIGSVAGASAEAQETRTAPVLAYVAPPELFRLDGSAPADPKIVVPPFGPMPAYDRPNGKRIGTFAGRLTTSGGDEGGAGPIRLQIGFPVVKRELHLNLGESGYMILGLTTEDEPVVEGDVTWSRIVPWMDGKRVPADAVWIRTASKDVLSYFDKATTLQGVEVWCERPGACRKAPQKLKDLLAEINDSQEPFSYSLKAVRASSGVYYRLVVQKRPGLIIPKDILPYLDGYFPAFRPDGTHVGQLEGQGC
ncbi:hypothetical protein [Alsobacter sp. R-9]